MTFRWLPADTRGGSHADHDIRVRARHRGTYGKLTCSEYAVAVVLSPKSMTCAYTVVPAGIT